MHLSRGIVLLDFRRAVNDLERALSCNFGDVDGVESGCCTAKGKQAEEDAKEDSQAVACQVGSVLSVVPESLVNPDGSNEEAVAIADVDAEVEESEGHAYGTTLLETSFLSLLKETVVVIDFELFLAKTSDNTDCSKGLLGVTGGLGISLHGNKSVFLHDGAKDAHADKHDGADGKHGKSKRPALVEGNSEARYAHAEGVDNLTSFLTDASLDGVDVLLET